MGPLTPHRPASSIRYSVFLGRARRGTATPILSALLSPRRECRSFSPSGTILTSHRTHTQHNTATTTTVARLRQRKFPSISATLSHLRALSATLSLRSHLIHARKSGANPATIDQLDPHSSFSLCITREAIGKEHTVPVIQGSLHSRAMPSEFVGGWGRG